jgi:hypothetical protein
MPCGGDDRLHAENGDATEAHISGKEIAENF